MLNRLLAAAVACAIVMPNPVEAKRRPLLSGLNAIVKSLNLSQPRKVKRQKVAKKVRKAKVAKVKKSVAVIERSKIAEPRKVKRRMATRAYVGQVMFGVASHYGAGDGFDGRKTACGNTFHQNGLTAAHKEVHRSIPCGTMAQVCNRDNGKCAKVTLNDRGPFIAGRDFDVSSGVAKILDFRRKGTAPVDVQILYVPK